MKLYEYAIIYKPNKKAREEGHTPAVIAEPTTVLCADDQAAHIHAARAIPDTYVDRLDQVEIALRPF